MVWLNGCPADWLAGMMCSEPYCASLCCSAIFLLTKYSEYVCAYCVMEPDVLGKGFTESHTSTSRSSPPLRWHLKKGHRRSLLLFFLQSFYCVGLTSTSNLFSYCTRWGSHWYEIKMCFQGFLGYTLIFWRSLSDILIENTWMQTWNLIYIK